MSTTAEKLTYLNTTKGKIKDSINLTGAGITTEPFRQYAVKLKDAYVDIINNGTDTLYNNFPKVSGSGTDVSLQNTYEAPMQSTLKGNTSQVQLSGKNLFNINEYTNAILRGGGNAVALTKEDDITLKTLNKVSQTQNYCLIPIPNSDNLLGKTITISGNITLNNVSATTVNMYFISDGTYIGNNIFSENLTSEGDFTLTGTIPSSYPSGATRLALGIYGSGSTVQPVNSYAIWKNIQLELGSTATTYEQYCGGTPSPNPSYPQDIHNVSGNNSVVVCGKNLCNILDQTKTVATNMNIVVSNQTITFNGSWSGGGNWVELDTKFSLGAGTYKFSKNTTISNFTMSGMYDSISQTWVSFTTANNFILTLNNPVNITKVRGWTNGLRTLNNATYKIQIEKGSTATTYEAYNGTTYNIDLPVENLLPPPSDSNSSIGAGNMTLTWNTNNEYKLSGNATSSANVLGVTIATDYTIKEGDYLHLCNDSTPSGIIQFVGLTPQSAQAFVITINSKNKVLDLTDYVGKTIHSVFFYCVSGASADMTMTPMIVNGTSKETSYTPYGTTPIELNKIGTYENNFLRNSGKNLFDKDNANVLNAYFNAGVDNVLTFSNNTRTIYVPCQPNTTYTISKTTSARFFAGYTNTTPAVDVEVFDRQGSNNRSTPITLTTGSQATYIVAFIYIATYDTLTEQQILDSIQIEKGNQATPYEPYGSGKWYLHKEIGKIVLNGSETGWSYQSRGNNVYRGYITIPNASTSTGREYALSNYFYAKGGLDESSGNIFINSSQVFLYTDITTIDDFKTWLSTHNTSVYYQLQTPTNTEITDTTLISQLETIYNAKSKNGTTNISQDNNDLPFIITASALEKEV